MLQRALPAGFIAPCCRKPNAVSPLQPACSWRISSGAQTARMDRRTINLSKSGRKVLGTNLNRSEASGRCLLPAPQDRSGAATYPRQIVHREAPTFYGGPVRMTGGGPLRITGDQKRGRRPHFGQEGHMAKEWIAVLAAGFAINVARPMTAKRRQISPAPCQLNFMPHELKNALLGIPRMFSDNS